ncbi:MAG: hypothetical protein EOP04_17590, partial [Proteobacteria bacterium]
DAAPNTLSAYLDSSKWQLYIPGWPTSYFQTFASPVTSGPSMDSCLVFTTTPVNEVSTMTLTFQVKPGYRATLSSFSFYNRSTTPPASGYMNWRMTINGTEVGADTLQYSSTPLLSTGTLAIAGPMSALTGTITVVLHFSNSQNKAGSVRIDNFVLNGFVQQIPNSGNAPITSADTKGYRYGFNGKEYDPEVYGEGNEQDYGMRIYDTRIGKFLSEDPLTRSYPFYTPYQFAGNMPIYALDLDGAEELPYMDHYQYDGSWGFLDRLKAIPNAAGKVYNHAVAGTWNSGVVNVRSLARGTWTKDRSNEVKQMATGIKQEVSATVTYHSTTPGGQQLRDFGNFLANPERAEDVLEFGFSYYTGSKFTAFKGNLLRPTTKASIATTAEIRVSTTTSLFGGNSVKIVADKTTTVVGRFMGGVEHIKSTGKFRTGANKGGINLLNLKNWSWEANEIWLKEAIARNDIIRAVSDPRKLDNIWENGKVGGTRTTFGKEVKLLEESGYRFNEKTSEFVKH